jgi:hypothetical protein
MAQSEVDEVNTALYDAVQQNQRGLSSLDSVTNALSMIPGTGGFIQEARDLQAASNAQAEYNSRAESSAVAFSGPPGTAEGGPVPGIPGMKIDPQEAMKKIYPILVFQYVLSLSGTYLTSVAMRWLEPSARLSRRYPGSREFLSTSKKKSLSSSWR